MLTWRAQQGPSCFLGRKPNPEPRRRPRGLRRHPRLGAAIWTLPCMRYFPRPLCIETLRSRPCCWQRFLQLSGQTIDEEYGGRRSDLSGGARRWWHPDEQRSVLVPLWRIMRKGFARVLGDLSANRGCDFGEEFSTVDMWCCRLKTPNTATKCSRAIASAAAWLSTRFCSTESFLACPRWVRAFSGAVFVRYGASRSTRTADEP